MTINELRLLDKVIARVITDNEEDLDEKMQARIVVHREINLKLMDPRKEKE